MTLFEQRDSGIVIESGGSIIPGGPGLSQKRVGVNYRPSGDSVRLAGKSAGADDIRTLDGMMMQILVDKNQGNSFLPLGWCCDTAAGGVEFFRGLSDDSLGK